MEQEELKYVENATIYMNGRKYTGKFDIQFIVRKIIYDNALQE